MAEHAGRPLEAKSFGKRLDSWKEIAVYLNRHVTTVRRWEQQEALPVHRHLHSKLGSIYAYTGELDTWFESRQREDADTFDPITPGSAVGPEWLPPPAPVAALPRSPVTLAGRDDEMKRLHQAWGLAAGGEQQIVLISGEAGIGKTRLALEFARSIAKRATVLVGGCDRESLVPFAPFVVMFQWLVRATPAQTLRRRVAAIDGGTELARLVPEITRRIYLAEEPSTATPEGHRYRMFEACAELLRATARSGPLLLVVDDVHYADRGSLLLLRHLARSTREAAICVLVTYRDDDDCTPESEEVLDDLRRELTATRIPLAALSADDVSRVIESRLGRPSPGSLTSFVVRYTEGNPLFVTEMLQHLVETGSLERLEDADASGLVDSGVPQGLRDLIDRRLRRLTPTARRLLTLAAVIGCEFRLSLLEAVAGVAEEAVLDALDEALAAQMITEESGSPGRFAFTHVVIRETLYGSITAARSVRLHHAIADALEQRAVGSPPALGELAYHFGQAAGYKDPEKALYYAVRAGDHAAAGLALEDAARYYEMALRAMDLLPAGSDRQEQRVDLQVNRGRCWFRVGQWARAKSAFEAAISLLSPNEGERHCELQVRLAETAFWLMDIPALRGHAAEAQALAGRIGRDDLWADALAWTASAQVADGDVLGGLRTDRDALARGGGVRSFALARVPLTLYWAGRLGEALEHAVNAVACARSSDDPAFLLYALQHLGLTLSGAGRYDEALQAFDEARAFGRRCGALPLLARATSMSVAPLLSLGDLEAAAARAFEARELAHRVGFEPPLVSAGIDLLLIFARSHDPGRAESLLGETAIAVQSACHWHAWKWTMRFWQARAELALARGAWTDAIRAATNAIDQSRPRHHLKYEALGLATRARARMPVEVRRAMHDAGAAVDVSRRLGDPALHLACLNVLLEIDGSDAVLAEAQQVARGILATLSLPSLRSAFLASASAMKPHVLPSAQDGSSNR